MTELARSAILHHAKNRVEHFRRNASGMRFWLHYCAQIGGRDLYHGVFVSANPDRVWVEHLYSGFVRWLIAGRHRKEWNKATGKYENSPVCPSTLMAIYSLALFPNKLFGRNVAGLRALVQVQTFALGHTPAKKAYLSKHDLMTLVNAAADYHCKINLDDPSVDDKYFLSCYLVFILMILPLYRLGNICEADNGPGGRRALDIGHSFSPVSRGGSNFLQISLMEKGDRLKKRVVPKRVVLYPLASEDDRENQTVGPADALQAVLKGYGLTGDDVDGPIPKPATRKGNAILLTGDFRKWLKALPVQVGVELSSLSARGKLLPRILRRSALTFHATLAPMHVVQKMAGHACIATTESVYAGIAADELLILQCDHQRALFDTEYFRDNL